MDVAVASTFPPSDLLASLRSALAEADEALLCVAFTDPTGGHLLEPQPRRLADRARLVTTTAFQTSDAALAAAVRWGVRVRILNPPRGTYHPKLYLARRDPAEATVGIGSA